MEIIDNFLHLKILFYFILFFYIFFFKNSYNFIKKQLQYGGRKHL